MRHRNPPVSQGIEAQTNSRGPFVPAGKRCRDGAKKSYFIVCHTMWAYGPATLFDYSSRPGFARDGRGKPRPYRDETNLAGANREPAGGSRRGRRKRCQEWWLQRISALKVGANTKELDVVKAQGYFACHAGGVGSIPTWSISAGQ
jgi:hypothetical protein